MGQGDTHGEELTERVPAEVVFFFELLNVLRSGTSCTSLEETAAVHERNDGKHFSGSAELENWEEVSEVVTENVTRHRNCVETIFDGDPQR